MVAQLASAALAALALAMSLAGVSPMPWTGGGGGGLLAAVGGRTRAVVVVVPGIRSPSAAVRPWSVSAAGSAVAAPLLQSLDALRPYPDAALYCPLDVGVTYLLTFWAGLRPVAVAKVDPSGCDEVREWGPGLKAHKRWALQNSAAGRRFWRLVAAALRLPERAVVMPGLARPRS